MRLLYSLKEGNMLAHGDTTIDNLGSHVGELLLESVKFLLDLVS